MISSHQLTRKETKAGRLLSLKPPAFTRAVAEVAAMIIAVKITHAYTHTHIHTHTHTQKHRQNTNVDEMNDPDSRDLKDLEALSFHLKDVWQKG